MDIDDTKTTRDVVGISIHDCWVPVTEERLLEFEVSLACQLPRGYREFLLRHNGGVCFAPLSFSMGGRGIEGRPGFQSIGDFSFFGIDLPDAFSWRDIEYVRTIHVARLPPFTLAIGDCSGDDMLLLDLRSGQVCLWEREAELTVEADANRIPVADSFGEFLANIASDVDQRRTYAAADEEPYISIEGFDQQGFEKWAAKHWSNVDISQRIKMLHEACEHANYDAIQWMLAHGAPSTGDVPTPIEFAGEGPCADIVLLLIAHGASVNDLYRNKRRPRRYIEAFLSNTELLQTTNSPK